MTEFIILCSRHSQWNAIGIITIATKPSDLRVLDRCNELWRHNILHVCGYEHYRNDLPYYAQYPASVYNWAVHTEGVSLREGKGIFDGVILGGFDNNPGSVLDRGSTSEVISATREIIESVGPKRLILGADCTIPRSVSLDRLELIRRVAAES